MRAIQKDGELVTIGAGEPVRHDGGYYPRRFKGDVPGSAPAGLHPQQVADFLTRSGLEAAIAAQEAETQQYVADLRQLTTIRELQRLVRWLGNAAPDRAALLEAWRQAAALPVTETYLAWEQRGLRSAPLPGEIVTHDGRIWRNDTDDRNVSRPGKPNSGWTDLGPAPEAPPPQEPEPAEPA